MKELPFPRLPDGTILHPVKCSVTLNLRPPSRATMLLPPEERLELRQRVELFTPQGSAGLFRVTAVEDVPGEGCEITLRHASSTLADALMPGSGELTGTPRQVFSALLSHQSGPDPWALGDVELPDSRTISCSYNHSNLLTALLNLLDELPEYGLFFEKQTVHLRKLDDTDACECRLSRNLRSLTVSLDDSGLCTRVYMNGLAEPVDAPSIKVWGPVSRHLTANRSLNAAALTALAEQYLALHSEPTLTVRLDALDLHRATGEAFDRFPPGRVCRVCLPESGQVIRQRVTSVTYEDVYGDPERAAVTLCERDPDAADYVGGLMANVQVLYRGLADANGLIRLQAERIELLAGDILLRATKEEVVELDERMTTLYNEVSIELDATNAELRLKASQEAVNELSHTLSEAMIILSGAEADILMLARRTDELTGDMTQAKLDIDGANAQITAQAGRLDAQGNELSSAKLRLDGLEGSIELLGQKTDQLTGDMTQAKLDINGATASITAQATRLDAQGNELSSAKLRLDGLEGSIELLGQKTDQLTGDMTQAKLDISGATASITAQGKKLDAQGNELSSAILRIDGLEGSISLKANKTVTDALGKRVSSAEISLESAVETINGLKSQITLKADKITLDGYVTMSEFSALKADVGSMWSGTVEASTIQVQNLVATNSVRLAGHTCSWKDLYVVTSVNSPTFNYVTLQYKDHSGNNRTQVVLTSVNSAASGNITKLEYMGY